MTEKFPTQHTQEPRRWFNVVLMSTVYCVAWARDVDVDVDAYLTL